MKDPKLPLRVESPACGDTIRIRIDRDDDGCIVTAPDFTLHVQADMSADGAVEAIRVAHMLKGHGQ